MSASPLLRPLRSRAAGLLLLLVTLGVALTAVLVLGQVMSPLPEQAHPQAAPLRPRLARQVLLVLLDGLRHDVAHDPDQMPSLAARMNAAPPAELWSSPISMTSSAVLVMGTGQRSDLEQLIANESHRPTVYDSLPARAREGGLRTAAVGDGIWTDLYPGAWTVARTHSSHSLEADEDEHFLREASELLAGPNPPDLTVLHLATPDKKAHAGGILSKKYRAYVGALDRKLERFLAGLSPSVTVLVTSDHGATEGGTHGSDTPEQRRSPFVAWGPGLEPQPRGPERLDQIDLPATLAVLLGVPSPSQGRGHVLVERLALSPEDRVRVSCAQLGAVWRYAEERLGSRAARPSSAENCEAGDPAAAIVRARRAVRDLDQRIGENRVAGPRALVPPALSLLLLVAAAWTVGRWLHGHRGLRTLLAAVPAFALALGLTWGLELLPGLWPDRARVSLYILGNLPLLWLLLRPGSCLPWLEVRLPYAALALPGALLLTEPKTTQPETFATLAVVGLVLFRSSPLPSLALSRLEPSPARDSLVRLLPALLGLALLALVGVKTDDYVPVAIRSQPWANGLVAAGCLGLYGLWRRRALSGVALVGVLAAGALGLTLRWSGLAALALPAWGLGLGALLGLLLLRPLPSPRHDLGLEAAWLLVWGLLSRDEEWPFVLGSLVLVSALATRLFPEGEEEAGEGRPLRHLLLLTVLFCAGWLQRVGVQGGMHFLHLDWGAGGFRQLEVSAWRIGLAIGLKHLLARAALFGVVARQLPAAARELLWKGALLVELTRISACTLMLYVARESFWTPLWVIADLPHALMAAVLAGFALWVETRRREALPATSS